MQVSGLASHEWSERRQVCPHCQTHFAAKPRFSYLDADPNGDWGLIRIKCGNEDCARLIVWLVNGKAARSPAGQVVGMEIEAERMLVLPRVARRAPLSRLVPAEYARVVDSATAILQDSPEASAALTRRAVQQLLIAKAGANPRNDLSKQIDGVLASGELPGHLAEQLDGVRAIGNFGAHPIKSQATGVIMDVQPGEAEWNIETLEALLDWYYVQADLRQRRREELNSRLAEAGKPPID